MGVSDLSTTFWFANSCIAHLASVTASSPLVWSVDMESVADLLVCNAAYIICFFALHHQAFAHSLSGM